MTDTRTYPPGVPSWIDLEPHDVDAATTFYGGLFGWTFENVMPPGAPGHYLIARLDDADVAGIGMPEEGTQAPQWNTYVAVADAEAGAAAVATAGGTVVSAPPPEPGPGGRAAEVADPQGTGFRLWQPNRRLGAQVTNVANAWNFSDLHTQDPAAVQPFYAEVFGWEFDDVDLGDGQRAVLVRQPGYGDHLASTVDPDIHRRQQAIAAPPGFADAVAWLGGLDDWSPTPRWHVTFSVADRDAALARALDLGGSLVSGPDDTAWTRTAVLADPQGAVFTISQFTPTTDRSDR